MCSRAFLNRPAVIVDRGPFRMASWPRMASAKVVASGTKLLNWLLLRDTRFTNADELFWDAVVPK